LSKYAVSRAVHSVLEPTYDVLHKGDLVGNMSFANGRPLRPGDVVEVKSPSEIFATLDGDSEDEMPFMPEMLRHTGRRYTVSRRVDKICDTVNGTGSRRMLDTVYLEDLRCDGSGHGGCQAGCRIYWKEAWLRRVDAPATTAGDGSAELERLTTAAIHPPLADGSGRNPDLWRCQATEAFKATTPLKTSNLSQYWRELRNGNYRLPTFLFIAVRGLFLEIGRRTGIVKPFPLTGPEGNKVGPAGLGVQPGELVRVRSREQVAATLDETGTNRRLTFDREMAPYCGKTLRVKDRVTKIIEDSNGRMLKLPNDCLILEDAVCSGERTAGCWYCPRKIYPFWREAWVERVEGPDGQQ
jgi:hypothetical protein